MPRIRPAAFVLVTALGLAVLLAAAAEAGRPRYGGRRVDAKEMQRIELGRRLFFDPVVSRSGRRSCASCHDPRHGFSDPMVRSEDDVGLTVRHSQTIIDSHRNPTAHWDGEFGSIEELVVARLGLPTGGTFTSHGSPLSGGGFARRGRGGGGYGPPPPPTTPPPPPPTTPNGEDDDDDDDDGPVTPRREATTRDAEEAEESPATFDVALLAKLPRVQDVLEESGRYDEAFKRAFGSTSVTTARLAEAIAAYCRSVVSTEAPYDRYRDGDETALAPAARRGLALFAGKAGCAACHTLKGRDPALTDFQFHNTGIAWDVLSPARRDSIRQSEELRVLDSGRERISRRGPDRRAFKTPTLRDVARRGPYMHTGAFGTLEDVVRYYAAGGSGDPRQDDRIDGFDVTDAEVADLVAFLEALTGDERPGRAPVAWAERAARTRLRFVDGGGRPLAGLPVTLYPVGDPMPGGALRERPLALETDERGWIEFAPFRRTHARIELGEGLRVARGNLVPDTCARARVTVPVKGRAVLMLTRRADEVLPPVLAVEHPGSLVLPGNPLPRTTFYRGTVLEVGDTVTARYEGWFRTDVPSTVRLRLPAEDRVSEKARTVELRAGEPVALDLTP